MLAPPEDSLVTASAPQANLTVEMTTEAYQHKSPRLGPSQGRLSLVLLPLHRVCVPQNDPCTSGIERTRNKNEFPQHTCLSEAHLPSPGSEVLTQHNLPMAGGVVTWLWFISSVQVVLCAP